MPGRTRPIEKFAEATAKCMPEGVVYSKCVSSNFQNVKKDMCAKEFLALKDCYLVSICCYSYLLLLEKGNRKSK
jgi:hypothetical protein